MSMISEQVKELRNYARYFKGDRLDGNLSPIFQNAADTIETLSTKMEKENMERSSNITEKKRNSLKKWQRKSKTAMVEKQN